MSRKTKKKPQSWHTGRRKFGTKTAICTKCGTVRTVRSAALMLLNAKGQPLTCFACEGAMRVTHLKRER